MKRDDMPVRVSNHHLRLAKSIASLKGMSMKDYLGSKVEEDAKLLGAEMMKQVPIKYDDFYTRPRRRGNIALDIIVLFVCLAVLGIFFINVFPPLSDSITSIVATTDLPDEGVEIAENTRDTFPSIYDAGFMFFFLGIWIFFLISAYFIDNHPIFFIIILIVMVLTLGALAIIGNMFENTVNASTAATNFPMIVFLSAHYLESAILIFLTVGIAFYAKNNSRVGL